MSKETLERAYKEIAKAEKASLQVIAKVLNDAKDKLTAEADKFPSTTNLPQTPTANTVQAASIQVTQLLAQVEGSLRSYGDDNNAPE